MKILRIFVFSLNAKVMKDKPKEKIEIKFKKIKKRFDNQKKNA